MQGEVIKLFMWGWQIHFRRSVEFLAKAVFEQLGVESEPRALLVGARKPGVDNPNPVCIDPEEGNWPVSLFSGLLENIEEVIANHPDQHMFYGDELTMRDKLERIRRDSVSTAAKVALTPYASENGVSFFCGLARPIDDYYVVPILELSNEVFEKFPPLKAKEPEHHRDFRGTTSLIHACVATLLSEASSALERPEPGRFRSEGMRDADEIIMKSASYFMCTPAYLTTRGFSGNLFEHFNMVASLMYEGTKGSGKMILVNPENPKLQFTLQFKQAVPFDEPRWVRKVLQMAMHENALISNGHKIYGLGKLPSDYDFTKQDAFEINFLDHYHWEFKHDRQVLFRSHYGKPKLPLQAIDKDLFVCNYSRLFGDSNEEDCERIWSLINVATQINHGCMVVISTDAVNEAERLAQQGTGVEPVLMTVDLLHRVSGIDGTILLDPKGYCHAVGVILDGEANENCISSRGARYNSAMRYVDTSNANRLALVVSDDNTVDVLPQLRPRVELAVMEQKIAELEKTTRDESQKIINWLEAHRFYFDEQQCQRINMALDRIDSLPKEDMRIYLITARFEPHRGMNASYLI